MQITTERLRIVPLTLSQLGLWVKDVASLEQDLDCRCGIMSQDDGFRQIVEEQLSVAVNDPENHLFYTFWLLIAQADRAVVGSACFKGAPDETGAVEIGYGLEKEYEKRGYMTEAVGALCRWAEQQPGVLQIIAQTDADNVASQRILHRAGFKPCKSGETKWWRLLNSSE